MKYGYRKRCAYLCIGWRREGGVEEGGRERRREGWRSEGGEEAEWEEG